MKLSDLKTGMLVTNRDGTEYIVLKDADFTDMYSCGAILVNAKNKSWNKLSNFKEDMKSKNYSHLDIVKVERLAHPYCTQELNYMSDERVVIWKEEPVKEITMAEIEAKFGCKVKIVKEK